MKCITSFTLVLCVAIPLAGCGGSGGGSDNTTVATTTTTTLPVSNIDNTTPIGSYGAGSDKQAAFDYLNAQRIACGFGAVQQQAQIDQAAQAHADYLVLNNLALTHYENQSQYPAGFTGVDVAARETAAGYNLASSDEVLIEAVQAYAPSYGEDAIKEFFVGPYHGYTQLLGFTDVGIGINARHDVAVDFGTTLSRPTQKLGWSDIATYPCAGTTGVLSQSYNDEVPAPIPGRNLLTNPIGTPIYIKARDNNVLTLTSYVLRMQGSTTPVGLMTLSRNNDPGGLIPDQSVMILIPTAPLAKNTTYVLTATGTNVYWQQASSPVNISFTFTTGAF